MILLSPRVNLDAALNDDEHIDLTPPIRLNLELAAVDDPDRHQEREAADPTHTPQDREQLLDRARRS